jgi:hypothetical protein
MNTKKTLRDIYTFSGFRARATLKPHPEDPDGCIVTLNRRQKKLYVPAAAKRYPVIVTGELMLCGTWMQDQPASILSLNIAGLPVHIVKP